MISGSERILARRRRRGKRAGGGGRVVCLAKLWRNAAIGGKIRRGTGTARPGPAGFISASA